MPDTDPEDIADIPDDEYWDPRRGKPRKYLDPGREEVNPEWRQWRDAVVRGKVAYLGGGSLEMYYPEDDGKAIPAEGAWIRVIDVPHTDLRERFDLPLLSMWRARPHLLNVGVVDGRAPRQAVIHTPGGDLHLWAHEYVMVPDITEYIGQEPHVTMHEMSGEPKFIEDDEERLFYLMKVGLSRRDAALMMLNDLDDPNFAYFTMHEAYVEMFAGVGKPLWKHIAENPRRVG